MFPERPFESEEGADGVKKIKPEDRMNECSEINPALTVKATESYDVHSTAVTTGILVSIGIGLFTACSVVYWIWKKMAENLQDKRIVVEHDSQTGDNAECKIESSRDQLNMTEKMDDLYPDGEKIVNANQVKCLGEDDDLRESACIGSDNNLFGTKEKGEMMLQDSVQNSTAENKAQKETECSRSENKYNQSVSGNTEDADMTGTRDNQLKDDLDVLSNCDKSREEEEANGDKLQSEDKMRLCPELSAENESSLVHLGCRFNGSLSISSNGMVDGNEDLSIGKMAANVKLPGKLYSWGAEKKETARSLVVLQDVSGHMPSLTINPAFSDNDLSLATAAVLVDSVSPPLQYLKTSLEPKDKEDGSCLSKQSDKFIFHQDNEVTVGGQPNASPQLQSLTVSKPTKNGKERLTVSKSLDSQLLSLKKGCQLLERKPFKSSLRKVGSDGCLKKYVHFPEDIRNIRTVHKYDSFDDSIYLNIDENIGEGTSSE